MSKNTKFKNKYRHLVDLIQGYTIHNICTSKLICVPASLQLIFLSNQEQEQVMNFSALNRIN